MEARAVFETSMQVRIIRREMVSFEAGLLGCVTVLVVLMIGKLTCKMAGDFGFGSRAQGHGSHTMEHARCPNEVGPRLSFLEKE